MADEWKPVFVLPNVQLLGPIGCELVALTPADDPRVVTLKSNYPAFQSFLGRFADNFGEKFEPAVLLVRGDAPPPFFDTATLASFRDLIAMSAIPYNRALELCQHRDHRVVFGEAFGIYSWMLDKHYNDVIGNTPAILGVHELAKFRGQCSPAIFRTALDTSDVDQPVLRALLARWQQRYSMTE